MIRRTLPLLCLGIIAAAASAAAADVEVARRWASAPPTIDGVVSPGEWDGAQVTPLAHGQLRTMNDGSFLYVMLDVIDDTGNDATSGAGPADYFVMAFDVDLNFGITPNVDLIYDACQDNRSFVKAYYLGGGAFTGCQNTDPDTLGTPGFGPTPGNNTSQGIHRFWEFRLKFAEIGVDPTTWTTSSGEIPHVRVNVATVSTNPPFSTAEPDPNLFPGFANPVFQVDLATLPIFPPGSTGPTFFGVGLVPSTFIDGLGYADINIPNYSYHATEAPFGGNLNVFGNWSLVFTGAAKYRVMASKNGGPPQPVIQTWTNFRFNFVTLNWDPIAFSPDANGRYPFVNPMQLWYLPNLLISWQTGNFGDGTYVLSLELFDASNNPLPPPIGNSLTLFVDNTPPDPIINSIAYDGQNACACAIVTQGDAPRGFTFDLSYTDPNGALNGVSLGAIFGLNQSTGIFSDSYSNHVNEDGPHRWNGEVNNVVPAPPFRAGTSCAYSFILSASSRSQNGYSLLFPNVQFTTSLTILVGEGAGSIDGCGRTLLGGHKTLNPAPMSFVAPGLRAYLARGFSARPEPAEEHGKPMGVKK
ncbi:MAG TPA: hypothetical protein VGN09_09755 [Vicinamibacteria bacterium]|jgi:hypothetical protein